MIINPKELHMALRDLENVRDVLERNKQTGSVYRVDKAIKHLSEVLKLLEEFDSCELKQLSEALEVLESCKFSGTDVEETFINKGIDS